MCFSKVINPTIDLPPVDDPAYEEDGKACGSRGQDDFTYMPHNSCIIKPLVVFMGGAADSLTKVLFEVAKDYEEKHHKYQDVYYRSHDAGATVVKLVEAYHASGRKVAVIGHSWGGAAAVHDVAMKTAAKIDILATLDPVERTRGKPLAKPPGVSRFINVYINYEKAESFNVNNIIARAGGPWENVPCADENHDFIAGKGIPPRKGIPDHAWADEMFSDLVKIHVEALR